MFYFHIHSKKEKDRYITVRQGETRIGQLIRCADEIKGKALNHPEIKFVLIGLPEDIGVRANNGIGGADSTWLPFLKSFLNIQETATCSGRHFLLYGQLKPIDPEALTQNITPVERLRRETESLDDLVFPIIQKVITAGKVPIIIGGGHNNAFPIIKGTSLSKQQPVHALNIDAHADFRAIEGRHSGNGFSYAFLEGYLKKYFALGLHEGYNSREMIQNMEDSSGVQYLYWEDIFLRHRLNWPEALQRALLYVTGDYFGVELDIDSIENTLSSAATPVGIQTREAMEALYQCGKDVWALYLHLPEGIAKRDDGLTHPLMGKLLSYLVQAFTKGVCSRS